MEIAGDPGPLLGARKAALPLCLPLGLACAILGRGDPLATLPDPVAGEPGGGPDHRPEEHLGAEAVAQERRRDEDDDASHQNGSADVRAGVARPAGHRVEGDRERERREAVAERVERSGRDRHDSEHRDGRETPRGDRERHQHRKRAAEGVELLVVAFGPVAAPPSV
jgi:hypothetical protein